MCESISNGESNTRLHPNEGGVKDNESAETTHSLMIPDQLYVADSSDASSEESHAGARRVDLAARPTPKPAAIGDLNADKQITSVVIGTTPGLSKKSELQSSAETESSEFEPEASFSKKEAVPDVKAIPESEPGEGEPTPGLVTKRASGDNRGVGEEDPDPLQATKANDPTSISGQAPAQLAVAPKQVDNLTESVEQSKIVERDERETTDASPADPRPPEVAGTPQSPSAAATVPAATPPQATPAVESPAVVDANTAVVTSRSRSHRLRRQRDRPCPRVHLVSPPYQREYQVDLFHTVRTEKMKRTIEQQYRHWVRRDRPTLAVFRVSDDVLRLAWEQLRAAGQQLHLDHEVLYDQLAQRILMLAMIDNTSVQDGVPCAMYDCSGALIHDRLVERALALIIEENTRHRECLEILSCVLARPRRALCPRCLIPFKDDMYRILFSPRNAHWLQLVALDERSSHLVARCPRCSSLMDYLEVPHLMRAMFFGYFFRPD